MGAGDLSGTGVIRGAIDEALEKQGNPHLRRTKSERYIDRTSSMTVAQIERFWKEAMRIFVERVAHQEQNSNQYLTGALRAVVNNKGSRPENNIDAIAAEAINRVFGRE